MRRLPYSKDVLEARRAGRRPWLVVVTMGDAGDRSLQALMAQPEVMRVWVPDDFALGSADLSWAMGLDVLVAPWCDAKRALEFVTLLWKAKPATVWQVDGGSRGTRLYPYRRFRDGRDLRSWHPARVPLDAGFRAVVAATRDHALLVADEPLFDQPAFAQPRAQLLAA